MLDAGTGLDTAPDWPTPLCVVGGVVPAWEAPEAVDVVESTTAAGGADCVTGPDGEGADGTAGELETAGLCRGAVGLNPGGRAWATRDCVCEAEESFACPAADASVGCLG